MKFRLFRDSKREWRWRLVARNKRIIGTGGEGYKRKGACKKMIEKIILGAAKATIEE